MRIFGWVKNKFNNKQEENKNDDVGSTSNNLRSSITDAQQEESNILPNTLLAVGTMGNCRTKEDQPRHDVDPSENLDTGNDLPDITIEEVTKLQKELTKLLTRKRKSSEIRAEDRANLPLDRFLNCPSSLEVDRTGSVENESTYNDNNGDLSPKSKLVISKVKDMLFANGDTIKKKSASFIFKKIFVCASGFTPPPSLRNSIPESRFEKILKAILRKKVHNQSSAAASTKMFLENNEALEKRRVSEEKEDKKCHCKWVKTDSEYIVLEM